MITNERQYKITRSELEKFREAIEQVRIDGTPEDVDTIVHEAMISGMESQAYELQESVSHYEALRDGQITSRETDGFSDFGCALIEARISARLTQKELAERIEVKEQQVQRWESSSYEGIKLSTVSRLLLAMNATVVGATVQFASANTRLSEVLLVGEKVKATLDAAGYATGGNVVKTLEEWVNRLLVQSIHEAKGHSRNEVTAKDIKSAIMSQKWNA